MPYEIFLALRYLRSKHRGRLARVTVVAAVIGIAVGVASLVVAFALSNGFRDEMRAKILQGTSHLSVLRSDGLPVSESPALLNRIRAVKGVVSVYATTYDGALASSGNSSTYAVLRGIDSSVVPRTWLQQGSFAALFDSNSNLNNSPATVVGSDLAAKLGVSVNDTFQLIPAGASTSGTSRRVKVAGIFRSGLFEYDSTWVYLSLETEKDFFGGNHAASLLSIEVDDVDQVKSIASEIRKELGSGYTTVDWQQANQPLFAALALERRMALFTIGMIIAIAVINIVTMLTLVVVERRRDIAVLNALGATRSSLMFVFVVEGALVGALGAALGGLLGVVACIVGNHYKLVSLPADVYSISHVPFNAHASEVLLSVFIAFVLSVVATFYPAREAARMKPVETLRET